MRLAKLWSPLATCLIVSAVWANDDNVSPDATRTFAKDGASLDQQIKEFLHKADRNGDGQLDQAEREAARRILEDRVQNVKERFDKNDNGKLDPREKAAFEKMREQRQELMQRADRKLDGSVDKKERLDARNFAQDHNGDGHRSPKERAAAERLHDRRPQEIRQDSKPEPKTGAKNSKYGFDLKQHKAPPLPNKNAAKQDKSHSAQLKADMARQFANKRHGAAEKPNGTQHQEKNAKGGPQDLSRAEKYPASGSSTHPIPVTGRGLVEKGPNPGSGQVVHGRQGGPKGGQSGAPQPGGRK